MTHNDIYTKFMIEYDKANVTSSYPSLTQYEVATILDKAYYALIAQKVTGNNPRQVPFESDVKAIADVQPLVKHIDLPIDPASHNIMGANIVEVSIPEDFMYYVQLLLEYKLPNTKLSVADTNVISSHDQSFAGNDSNQQLDPTELFYGADTDDIPSGINWQNLYYSSTVGDIVNDVEEQSSGEGNPYDKKPVRLVPVKLTSHDVAEKFIVTPYNMPWVKVPVAYMQGGKIDIVYDPINKPMIDKDDDIHLVYVHKPTPFATTVTETTVDENEEEVTVTKKAVDFSEDTQFELLDSMAEELINLAIIMALENVESARMNTKLNMRGLES